MNAEEALSLIHIAVVIPAYRAEKSLAAVLAGVPAWVRTVIVVEDGSDDRTLQVAKDCAIADSRIQVLTHESNRGVGGAMQTGYLRALEGSADVVVKMDSDGQMDPAFLPYLVLPLALGEADYTKGNRFLRPESLVQMPWPRLLGNAALSFITKLSSGYWTIMDPTNGYTAISREALLAINLGALDDGYFFESSLLSELGLARAVVRDVSMPSRYGEEESQLSVVSALMTFGPKHVARFGRRLITRYFVADFSAASLLIAAGLPLTLFGVIFGLSSWQAGAAIDRPATAGTVMLAAFTTAGGLYCLVQAMVYDILAAPQRPITIPRLGLHRSGEYLGDPASSIG